MNYTIKSRLSGNVFFIVFQKQGETEQVLTTPLDKLGCDLMVKSIEAYVTEKTTIDDCDDKYYTVNIQLDSNGGTEGIIVDVYDDYDDGETFSSGEPVDTRAFWFEDYSA